MHEALDQLAETFSTHTGYFTRADALAAGADDAVFEALVAEHKIESVTADIYHLSQYPHADREDLIVLWLQTDRQGIISHETALSLHDLCDILPSRLHITVQNKADPAAARKLLAELRRDFRARPLTIAGLAIAIAGVVLISLK